MVEAIKKLKWDSDRTAIYTARIIGIVYRHNDVEDKLVAAPEGFNFDQIKISEAVHFQEQYYESEIEIFN